jgi:hypothetical protein
MSVGIRRTLKGYRVSSYSLPAYENTEPVTYSQRTIIELNNDRAGAWFNRASFMTELQSEASSQQLKE